MPFFSIVIPTFNRKSMVKEAVDSVLSQSFRDFEIIVIDDGSVDGTHELLTSYKEEIIYRRQENSGVAAARNLGLSLSSGSYICYLDSDDIWPEDRLSEFKRAIEVGPDAGFIFSNFRKHDVKNPEPYSATNSDIFPCIFKLGKRISNKFILFEGEEKLKLIFEGYPLYPSTFAVRRDVHDNFRWDPGILKSEDFNFVLRVSKRFDFLYIDEDLATVRIHGNNKSMDFLMKNRVNILSMKLYRDLYASKKLRPLCNYYISRRLFLDGRSYLNQRLYISGLKLVVSSLAYRENWSRLAKKVRGKVTAHG